jgi:hypothetical protein
VGGRGSPQEDGGDDAVLAEMDAGPDADTDTLTALDAADVVTDAPVCVDACPNGDCVLSRCAVRLVGGLDVVMNAFADPGATGSVFFSDYFRSTVYRYDKAGGHLVTYTPSSGPPRGLVANGTDVFWGNSNTGIGWAPRSGTTSSEVDDSSYDVSWNLPWALGVDTGFVYWVDRDGADCWRMDLAFKAPELLYREVPLDAGPPPEQFGSIAVDPGPDGFVFFVANNHVNRMTKTGTGLTAFAPVTGQPNVAFHAGYVYWMDAAGALLRSPEDVVPSCDAGTCGQVVVPAGMPSFGAPWAFDDAYIYWIWQAGEFVTARLARMRQDGSSPNVEIVAEHLDMTSVAVDDVAVYYTTTTDNGTDAMGSLWRLAK